MNLLIAITIKIKLPFPLFRDRTRMFYEINYGKITNFCIPIFNRKSSFISVLQKPLTKYVMEKSLISLDVGTTRLEVTINYYIEVIT